MIKTSSVSNVFSFPSKLFFNYILPLCSLDLTPFNRFHLDVFFFIIFKAFIRLGNDISRVTY
eukprot:UN03210